MADPPTLPELTRAWRARAAELRAWAAAESAAVALERAADELDTALRAEAESLLTLAAASEASGYTVAHLERLIREGKLSNAGRKHAPRLRRRDIPRKPDTRKPGCLPSAPGDDMLGIARGQVARAVVHADRGA